MKLLKQKVRKSVREAISKLSQEQVNEESIGIVKRLKNHEAYQKSQHVCFFMPMVKEVDLTELLHHSLKCI
jgi:5-formyltetrahydrofolate cyclo-ligase